MVNSILRASCTTTPRACLGSSSRSKVDLHHWLAVATVSSYLPHQSFTCAMPRIRPHPMTSPFFPLSQPISTILSLSRSKVSELLLTSRSGQYSCLHRAPSLIRHIPIPLDAVLKAMPSFIFIYQWTHRSTLIICRTTWSGCAICYPLPKLNFFLPPDTVQPVNWGGLFRRCEKITTIEAREHGTTTLLQTLTPPKPVSRTSGGKGRRRRRSDRDAQVQRADDTVGYVPPVFPKLKTLVLKELDFSENVPRCGNLYDILMNLLRRRKSHNVALKSLIIEYSIITANRADALERLVPEFHCGKEGRLSSHDLDDEFDYSSDFVDHWDRWEDFIGEDVFVGSSQGVFDLSW
jgi:hypothetical protein